MQEQKGALKENTGRREISVEDVAEAQRTGNNHILENLQIHGTAVIRDKHGNIKGELTLTNNPEDM